MTPALALGPRSATAVAALRRAREGLAGALAGREPRLVQESLGPRHGPRLEIILALAAVALAIINVASVHATVGGHVFGGGAVPAPHQPAAFPFERLAAAAAVAPLLLAARAPLLAWRTGWLVLLLAPLLPVGWWGGWPWGPAEILALLTAFCVAGIGQRRAVFWSMWALTLLPWWLWLGARLPNLDGPLTATVLFTAIAAAVDGLNSGRLARRRLAAETGRADAERDRRAVLEERTRIARELHDVVAHHMSLIAVRAESASYRLADLHPSALAEFGDLSQLAREALSDMRRLLGVLRQDPPAGLEPQPQLSDLPGLIDAARRAGVSVSMTSTGESGPIPASISLCSYRIVQEALSNASQHAPGTPVSIRVDRDKAAIRLHIANGPGRAGSAGAEPQEGHGLTGMRERVTLLGGSLTVGSAVGGFAVTAILPLADV